MRSSSKGKGQVVGMVVGMELCRVVVRLKSGGGWAELSMSGMTLKGCRVKLVMSRRRRQKWQWAARAGQGQKMGEEDAKLGVAATCLPGLLGE